MTVSENRVIILLLIQRLLLFLHKLDINQTLIYAFFSLLQQLFTSRLMEMLLLLYLHKVFFLCIFSSVHECFVLSSAFP